MVNYKIYMEKLEKVNEKQIEFAKLLGLNVTGLTKRVALRMIHDNIHVRLHGEKIKGGKLKAPTEKQINFGKKFGLDFSKLSSSIAFAYISDLMVILNFKSIEEQNIIPGDCVINKHDKLEKEYIVSSINKDGYIYFKKSSGANARHLVKINKGDLWLF